MHVPSAEEQDAILSGLDDIEAIKAIMPLDLDGTLTDDEKKLYDPLVGYSPPSSTTSSLDEVDSVGATSSDPASGETVHATAKEVAPELGRIALRVYLLIEDVCLFHFVVSFLVLMKCTSRTAI